MTTAPKSYVSQEMLDRRNVWSPPRTSPPISVSDIRKWAIAVYWPEEPPRLYWDEEYAKTTHWGGIIAPQDFNPFAWPVEQKDNVRNAAPVRVNSERPLTGMNGGQTDTYGVPMRPGDVITTRSALVDWEENEGRLGLTLYIYNEIRWTNQKDELVKTRRSVAIRY
jgi:hypothetical protein